MKYKVPIQFSRWKNLLKIIPSRPEIVGGSLETEPNGDECIYQLTVTLRWNAEQQQQKYSGLKKEAIDVQHRAQVIRFLRNLSPNE